MTEPARTIGEFNDYQGFMAALRTRANELHLSRSDDDNADVAGLPNKYIAKLLGPRPVRRVGMKTLGPLLGVLQVKLILVVDEEAVRRYGGRVRKRDERLVRNGNVTIEFSHRHMKRIGRNGGKKRALLGKTERIRLARIGGLALQAKRRLARTGTFDWRAVKQAVKPAGAASR